MPVIPQIIDQTVQSSKKRNYVALVAVLLVMAGMYYLIFDIVIPKTAAFTTPQKWRMIPLRQPKEIVHDYLGKPVNTQNGVDVWTGGSKGKMYFLRMYYVSDTIASGYAIHYHYSNSILSRKYLIDSVSIR